MGFVGWRPFGYSPESVHHSTRSIGKFVGEPPLRTEWRVRATRQALKIGNPIVGAIGRFFVGHVSGFCEVQRLDGGKPRAVAIAALVGKIAAEFLAIALFRGNGRAMDDVLGPLWSSLHPGDQFA